MEVQKTTSNATQAWICQQRRPISTVVTTSQRMPVNWLIKDFTCSENSTTHNSTEHLILVILHNTELRNSHFSGMQTGKNIFSICMHKGITQLQPTTQSIIVRTSRNSHESHVKQCMCTWSVEVSMYVRSWPIVEVMNLSVSCHAAVRSKFSPINIVHMPALNTRLDCWRECQESSRTS